MIYFCTYCFGRGLLCIHSHVQIYELDRQELGNENAELFIVIISGQNRSETPSSFITAYVSVFNICMIDFCICTALLSNTKSTFNPDSTCSIFF